MAVTRFPTMIDVGDEISINGEIWKVNCVVVTDSEEENPDRMTIELTRLYRHKLETRYCKSETT